MFSIPTYIFLSVFLVSLISFLGACVLLVNHTLLKKILLLLVSFAAGTLLGDAIFHLLPEAVEQLSFSFGLSVSLFLGVFLFFVLEKFICWHHCHDHSDHPKSFVWMNLVGDGAHNFIDGFLIAISYLASIPIGIATTVAVLMHEIPQEMGDFGILLHGGFSAKKALLFNFLSSLFAFVGAVVGLVFAAYLNIAYLLALTAGSFLYIAATDLLPELHKTTNKKQTFLQACALLLGVFVMILLL